MPEYSSAFAIGVPGGKRISSDIKITTQSVAKQLAFMRDFYSTLWGPRPYPALFEIVEAFDKEEGLQILFHNN